MYSRSIDHFGFCNRPVVYHPSGPRQSRLTETGRERLTQLSRSKNNNTGITDNTSSSRNSRSRTKHPSIRLTAEDKEERQQGHPQSQPLSRSQQLLLKDCHLDLPPIKTASAEEFCQLDGRGDGVDILNDEGNEEVKLMYRRLDLLSRLDNVNNRYMDEDWLHGHERTKSCPLLLSDPPIRDEEEVELIDDNAKDRTEGSGENRTDVNNATIIPCCNDSDDCGSGNNDDDIAIDRGEQGRAKKNRWDSEDQDRDQDDEQDLLLSSSLERDCSSSSSFPPRTIVLRPDGRFYTMLEHHVDRSFTNTTTTLSRPSLWSRTRSSGRRHPVGYDRRHHRRYIMDDDEECNDDDANNSTSKLNTRHDLYNESSNGHPDEAEENNTDDEDDEAPPHIIAFEDISDDEDEDFWS